MWHVSSCSGEASAVNFTLRSSESCVRVCLLTDELLEYTRPLVSIAPEASLFEAIQMLYKYRVHRLPVIDTNTGNALFIMTHKRILRFLFLYVRPPSDTCKCSPYSITKRRVPELIPVLGSQPACDMSHKPGCHYFPPGLQLPPQC